MLDSNSEKPVEQSAFVDNSAAKVKPHSVSKIPFFFSLILAVVVFSVLFLVLNVAFGTTVALVTAALVAVLSVSTIHICMEWERVVVMRFGKFSKVIGPGLYFIIPFVEVGAARIDTRIRTVSFGAEEALTADLVPVDVDAVLYWGVWDARKAYTEIEHYADAVALSGQTALRDAIGRVDIADLAMRRKDLDRELQEILEEKTANWGVSVISIEIRNITIPVELQDAMSKEAQAVRERNARITLAEVEKDISEMFVEAADVYCQNDKALQLRAMNLIHESVKDKGGLIVAPSDFADAFNNLTNN